MTARRLTRRSLLAGAAGALLGEALRPADTLAGALAPGGSGYLGQPSLFERAVGSLPSAGPAVTVALAREADLIGVLWRGPADARIELRFRGRDARWSRWVPAGERGHAPEGTAHSPARVGDEVWTGGASEVQLRCGQAVSDVRLGCVDVGRGSAARALATAGGAAAHAAAAPLAMPVLDAGPGQPPILARRVWARGLAPAVAPEYGSVELAFVHHTETPNGYLPAEVPAMLRAIYAYHRYVKGWDDIGYNFVVDLYGRIFEARAGGVDEPVAGAQAGGYNLLSTGVAVLGEFMSAQIPPAAAAALERLLAWKLALHGRPVRGRVTVRVDPAGAVYSRFPGGARVSLPRVAGHRDADTTDCPGDALYGQLPALRAQAHALAGSPVQATLALGPAAAEEAQPNRASGAPPATGQAPPAAQTPGQQPGTEAPQGATGAQGPAAPQTRLLTGTLSFLDGTPIPGAPIAIQARSVARRGEVVLEQTLAQATTDAGGSWSLAAAIAPRRGGSYLRALYPGGAGVGAAVSDPLRLPGTVTITPAQATQPTS